MEVLLLPCSYWSPLFPQFADLVFPPFKVVVSGRVDKKQTKAQKRRERSRSLVRKLK